MSFQATGLVTVANHKPGMEKFSARNTNDSRLKNSTLLQEGSSKADDQLSNGEISRLYAEALSEQGNDEY